MVINQNLSRDSRYYLTLKIEEVNQIDITNNTSNIYYELSMTKTAGTGYYDEVARNKLTLNIDGEQIKDEYITYNFSKGTPYTIVFASGIKNIRHENNGEKTISFSASFVDGPNNRGSAYINSSLKLTTIPRKTDMFDINGYVGDTLEKTLSPKSDNFTHSLYISIGNKSGYINQNGLLQSTEYKFNKTFKIVLTNDFYDLINQTSISGSLTLNTYNGNTLLGSDSSRRITVNTNSGKPYYSKISLKDLNETTKNLTKNENKIIPGYSDIEITFNLKACQKEDDTNCNIIKKELNGTTFEEDTIHLGIIPKEEYKNLKLTLQNSRGIEEKYTIDLTNKEDNACKDINFLDYKAPTINANFKRTSQTSDKIEVYYTFDMFSGKFSEEPDSITNYASLKVYNVTSTGEWESLETISGRKEEGNLTEQVHQLGDAFPYKENFTLGIEIQDQLHEKVRLSQFVTAGIPNFSIGDGWFQHHTDVYDKNGEIINNLDIDKIYPVGSIYFSTKKNFDPGSSFGGVWEQIAPGRVLVGVDESQSEFNTVKKMGGHKDLQSHSHYGTTSNAGWHTHQQQGYWSQPSGSSTSRYCMSTDIIGSDPVKASSLIGSGDHTHSFTTSNTGSGNAGNLQPYLTCYIWERIE